MLRRSSAIFLVYALAAACATNNAARTASHRNAQLISQVQIGDTMVKVLRMMSAEPEIRDMKVTEAGTEEVWSYVTNYESDIVTQLRFRDRRVVEKSTGVWNQAWSRDTVADSEDLRTPDEQHQNQSLYRGPLTSLLTFRAELPTGTLHSIVVERVGVPTSTQSISGVTMWLYQLHDGTVARVRLQNGRVMAVEAHNGTVKKSL